MKTMRVHERGGPETLSHEVAPRSAPNCGEAVVRFAAIGVTFPASVAHEVKQPLAAIVADASACRRWLTASTPNYRRVEVIVERILNNAMSAADIVDRLHALFASSDSGPRALAQVNEVICEACAQLAPDLEARRVDIVLQLEPMLPSVPLDRILIRQLLTNLIRNGVEAMETSEGRRQLEVRSSIHHGRVRVDVCDQGSGVADTMRMFDAFFSTKPKGMGMGLAICRQIVEAHSGRLWMEPNKVRGTRMIFTLPIRDPFADKSGDA